MVTLEGFDDRHFVFRGYAGEYRGMLHDFAEFFFGHGVEFLSGNDLMLALGNPQVDRHSQRSVPIVAGDHNGANASLGANFYRFPRFCARRVDHAQEANKDQVLLDLPRFEVGRHFREIPIADSQNPQGLFGHRAIGGENTLAYAIVEFGYCLLAGDFIAPVQ